MREVLRLQMLNGAGTIGAGVAFHGKYRYYYASIAGNLKHPMAIFNIVGERVSPGDLATMFDTRGIWFNPAAKTIQASGFGGYGITSYVIDEYGIPYNTQAVFTGNWMPDDQASPTMNPRDTTLYILDKNIIRAYHPSSGKALHEKNITVKPGVFKPKPPRPNQPPVVVPPPDTLLKRYNNTSIAFTPFLNAEIGLLNIEEKAIELYSRAEGIMTQKLLLPQDAPVSKRLNFSFANNIYWLFDARNRVWIGYR
ncbi:MAG: hypothetical protein ACO3BD_00990 [Chitinophagaceae bacterium]